MRKADDLIQNFLDSVGQSEGAHYTKLFQSWKAIVGEHIAAHAQPVDVRATSLYVEADHPGWVQMVMLKRNQILSQLKRRVPQIPITGLSIRVRGDGTREPAESAGMGSDGGSASLPRPAPKPPSADEKQALERIEDEDLRGALERLRKDLGPE